MDVAHVRAGSVGEWLIAAGFLAATLLVASLIVRELRTAIPAAARVRAEERAPAVLPAGVPARAISVPVLLLGNTEIRVGDSVDRIAMLLGRRAEIGTQVVERGPIGERLTRFYEYAGTRFVLVFEPFETNGRPRVVGIYLQ